MRRLIGLACAVVFLDVSFFVAITPLIPEYRAALDLSDAQVGLLSGSYAFGTLIFAIPGGLVASRIGPRKTVIAGLAGLGVASVAFGFSDSILALDISRFSQGACGALVWAGILSWLIGAAPRERRGEVIGTAVAAAIVGELAGAPIGALASLIGTEIVFGSVLVVAAVLIVVALGTEDASETETQSPREALQLLRGTHVAMRGMFVAAPALAFGAITVLVPLRLEDLGAGALVIAGAFAAGAVLESVISPLAGRYSDRAGRLMPYLAGMVFCAVGVAVIGTAEIVVVVCAAVVVTAVGSGLSLTPAMTGLSDEATASGVNQGLAMGIGNVTWGGGQMLGSVGCGVLAGLLGYAEPALIISGLVLAAALLARRTGQNPPAPLTDSATSRSSPGA